VSSSIPRRVITAEINPLIIFGLRQYRPAALTLVGALFASPAIQAEEAQHDSHESYHKNTIGFFAGITGEDRRERAPTLAIEYERQLNEKFGVGFTLERAFGDLDFNVYVAGAAYHSGAWKYFLGAGIEDGDHGSESLVRVGLKRASEVGSFEIAPQFTVDFIDGDSVIVLGVVFAKGF
jgi:hypothetical protein